MAATRKKRTYNTRLVKQISYRIEEIAELFDIHTNSVRQWQKAGLKTIDDNRPAFIHGSDLIEFLKNRQSDRKQKCQPNEFWCCRCRKPVSAWENLVDLKIRNDTLVNLTAICGVCDAGLNKAGSLARISEYRETFDIQTVTDSRLKG